MRIGKISIGVLSLIIFFTNPTFAQIKSMSLQIDGLSCPFCVLGLEKKLKSVPMISDVDVHLKKARTDLDIKPGSPLDLLSIRQAVKEAGFTLKDIHVTVFGIIKRDEDGFFIVESQGDKQKFFLFDEDHTDVNAKSPEPQVLDKRIESQLSNAEKENKLVGIEGVIHQHADMPFGLLIKKLEINSE